MLNEIILYILTGMLGAFGLWFIYVTKKIISIDYSVKYINKNLYFIDWDKVPRKNLNDIFNNKDK